jgi:hypothetical protein
MTRLGFLINCLLTLEIELELGPSRIEGFLLYIFFSFRSHTAISQPNSTYKSILSLL